MTDLTGLRVAVLATNGFEQSELTEPVRALKEARAEVSIISLKPGEIQALRHDAEKGVTVHATVLRDVRAGFVPFIYPAAPSRRQDANGTGVQRFLQGFRKPANPFPPSAMR